MRSTSFSIFRHLKTFTILTAFAVTAAVMGLACAKKVETQQTASVERREIATPTHAPTATPKACELPEPEQQQVEKDSLPAPVTDASIALLHSQISEQRDYAKRVEKRRDLFHALRRESRLDEAMGVFKEVLDDIEQKEGQDMAQRAALADAATLQGEKDHRAAISAYQVLLERFPKGRFVDEAIYHWGECHLELQEYEQAEAAWHRLVEEQDSSPLAPWAWRKLALAQLLRGQFDTSLGTLEIMTDKYTNTHWAEYAKMRRGYVLTVANRVPEAKAAYQKFLAECANSRYCVLAKKQLMELDDAVALAKSRNH